MNTPGDRKPTYYDEHKPYILERLKNYYIRNRDIIRDKQRTYYALVTRPRKGYEERGLKTTENLGGDLEIIEKGRSITHSKTPILIEKGNFLVNFD